MGTNWFRSSRSLVVGLPLLVLIANAPPPGAAAQGCTRRQAWGYTLAACQEWCLGVDCCRHEHLSLTWGECLDGGTKLAGDLTPRYFQAKDRDCGTCAVNATGSCSHYVDECFVEDCP